MKLKFEQVELLSIRQLSDPEFGWVVVEIRFLDEDTGAYPSLRAEVPLLLRPESTLSQIQDEALEAAKNVAGEYLRHSDETTH